MKTIGVIEVDLDLAPIGTRSRVGRDLLHTNVLNLTLERARQIEGVDPWAVVAPRHQAPRIRDLLGRDAAAIHAFDDIDPPYRTIVRLSRKWALHGWRGGFGGSCHFDEHVNAGLACSVAREYEADAVCSIPPAAPLLDAELGSALVRQFEKSRDRFRMCFAQAPPGLAPTVHAVDLLHELAAAGTPPGWLLAYRPNEPRKDMALLECCVPTPALVRHTGRRLTADTRRSFELIEGCLAERRGDPRTPSAEAICRWTQHHDAHTIEPLPQEVEIELTTEDQLPDTTLRPRGSRVPPRGPVDLAVVERVVGELASYDDSLLVLGGFGEPLLHPEFSRILRICREAGIYGVAVRTNGLALDESVIKVLLDAEVDIVNVLLDSVDEESYRQVHRAAGYDRVVANLAALERVRAQRNSPAPILAPEMVKCRSTMSMTEVFFDRWIRAAGCATIAGYAHCAEQMPGDAWINMSPPGRVPCRRLRSRCVVLADGAVVACDQDFAGRRPMGNVQSESLGEIWQGKLFETLRASHRQLEFGAHPLCSRCAEWHRP